VSRLNDLLRELRSREPALARDLEREVAALADRRAFGLNFERHVPEVVELPGRKVRKGDKVRILPSRGQVPKKEDEKVWRAVGIDRSTGTARLESLGTPVLDSGEAVVEVGEGGLQTKAAALDDLVVVAEFRDSIYPGLVSTGKIERGGNKPFHTVINAENFHALETLLFTHRGKVDCIYIDPPYNSGAQDWKYNNDYVESDDLYRHSKWLAFMERRLLLAKELLNPMDSVLIVTIDEKEYLRLGLLLEQVVADGQIQMVSTVINRKGNARRGEFSRCEEFIYFVRFGSASVSPWLADMLHEESGSDPADVRWKSLLRLASTGQTSGRFNLFYPLYFDRETLQFRRAGEPLAEGVDIRTVPTPPGESILWPISKDGSDGRWSLSVGKFNECLERGYIKFGRANGGGRTPYYLMSGQVEAIAAGNLVVTGKDSDGAVELQKVTNQKQPMTVWNRAGHSTSGHGTTMLRDLLPDRRFPYPKSLYAVEDAVRFVVADRPQAVVLDFFAGSGTTAHAVMRLNKQDGGRRKSIIVTNNEVAADEQKALRQKGLRPGDSEWEKWGICEYITKPRIEAAITGRTRSGEPIKGDYKFTDEFPLAEGFEENVEFFTLTYEAPLRVASNREFAKIAPLLWMRAGARGRRIEDVSAGWDVADVYGVLADLDDTEHFLKAIAANDNVGVAFIVTDEDRLFESVAQKLPDHVEPVRLYEAYLRNFEIESGRGSL
jgi:adenine-specific DNA-methyltransferase